MQRIPLDNDGAEGSSNAYLLTGDRTALVDTGASMPGIREQLETGLSSHGVAVEDVEVILLTHWHADHAGLAGAIQRESGATVRVHAGDAGLVSDDDEAKTRWMEARDRLLDEWDVPPDRRAELLEFMEIVGDAEGEPVTVEPLEDGERIRAGDEVLRAIHVPGHTAGMTCFAREDGTVLSGDALLPDHAPNVGGADPRVDSPLDTYHDSLQRLVQADYERALPGHGSPIDDPTGRARELRDHHFERARRVLDVLDDRGPATAWSVSEALFGDVEGIHILYAPGEAWAHLEHVREAGLVERTDDGYVSTREAGDGLDDLLA